MSFAVQRLGEREGARAALVAHFLALPARDRNLRFGVSLAPTVIASYADRIDFLRDAVFGVHDDWRVLIGVAHMAIEGDRAELGLSVLPAHRGRGVGSALFRFAVAHARDHRVPRLFMHCLAGNAPVIRIAEKFGMEIVIDARGAVAHIRLQSSSQASVADAPDECPSMTPVPLLSGL